MSEKMKFEIDLVNLERNIIHAVKTELEDNMSGSCLKMCNQMIEKELQTIDLKSAIDNIINEKINNIILNTEVNGINITEYIVKNTLENIFSQAEQIKRESLENINKFISSNKYSLVEQDDRNVEDNLMLRVETLSDEDGEYRLNISLNNKNISLGNGEPEDMTLNRDLNDAYKIEDFIKIAYQYGRNGKKLYYSSEEIIDED